MKKILYITPSFGSKGTIYKHNLLFLDAVKQSTEIYVAAGKQSYENDFAHKPVLSYELPLDKLNAVVNRLFPNRVFYGSDPFKQPRIPFLKSKCENFIRDNQVDIIHTVCRPYFAHKIGYNLKKKYGLPWVAQFLDAWLDNPDRTVPKYLQRYDAEQEAMVAHNADIILHTNKQLVDIWHERYGDVVKNKMYVMAFCFNNEQIVNAKSLTKHLHNSDGVIDFSYIGISMGNRNLQDVIEATNILINAKPHYRKKFQISIVGNYLQCDSLLVAKYNLHDIIIHKGYLRGEDLQKAYTETDVFIVVDSPMKRNVFFPSKLLDYFYYQKPILGITSKFGVTNDLLTEAGHTPIENGNITAIVEFMDQVISNYNSIMSFDREYFMTFAPEKVNTLYTDIIESL